MKAEIITIGDEILLGQIVDSNSAWIAQQLIPLNIPVIQISSVADTPEAITGALSSTSQRSDLVLVTGGLGPTKDDVTKQTIASFFDTTLIRDEAVLLHVQGIFERLGYEMVSINDAQADVLACCEVLFNEVGTAPGMWVERNGTHFVFLPGVPFEMKYLIQYRVLPKLKGFMSGKVTSHKYLLTVGVGESIVAERIVDIESNLPQHIKLAYLPRIGLVRLRLSGEGDNAILLDKEMDLYSQKLVNRLQTDVVALEDVSFEQVILNELVSRGCTLSLAESCTGGQIASSLTQCSGASAAFLGSIVAYSNDVKVALLGVKEDTLRKFGAVSQQTVIQMVEGAKERLKSDYAIATSGIAGPTGGTPEKPVGTIWVAVSGKYSTVAKKFLFHNDRLVNIERTVMASFLLFWELFKQENGC